MTAAGEGLAPEEVAAMRRDGFHFPIEPLTEKEAAAARADCEEYLGIVDRVGGFLSVYRYFPKIHLFNMWAYEIARNERILAAVRSLIGPDVLVWGSELFQRKAGGGSSLAWHQDSVYYGLDGVEEHAVRVWVALTPANEANGTLRFSRGSHLLGPQEHAFGGDTLADKMRGEEVRIDIDPGSEVAVELRAGQASMHSMLVAHCSGENTSGEDRLNFAVDYVSPKVVPATPDSALLVSGADHGRFRPEQAPEAGFGQEEVRRAMAATRLRVERTREGTAGAPGPG
ncbi:phytanoyl-CoA dioxygenase family protein [Nocardiopsis potens]|uniref:phytanoyl-CoA dioxygenase family protein n=1 Tax=Nocardiopsis potens TaxID=1246458 RepID=UPI00034839BC|nr:phytanoyl-CoA dioxygenase family protein [Nocardiopsis potens]